jgi:hypothetical protein
VAGGPIVEAFVSENDFGRPKPSSQRLARPSRLRRTRPARSNSDVLRDRRPRRAERLGKLADRVASAAERGRIERRVETCRFSAFPRPREKGFDVLDRTPKTAVDHLRCHPRVVRRQHHVRQREQVVAGRNGFLVKDVQRGASDP